MPSDHQFEDLLPRPRFTTLSMPGPADADLAHAPMLDRWVAMQDRIGRVMLFGHVTDHAMFWLRPPIVR